MEERGRHVVGRERDVHAGVPQALERNDRVLGRAGARAEELALLEEVAVRVGRHDHAEVPDAGDLVGGEGADVLDDPASVSDRHDTVHVLVQVEEVRPHARDADLAPRGLPQHLPERGARQGRIVGEASPARVGHRARSHGVVECRIRLADEARDAEKGVAGATAGDACLPGVEPCPDRRGIARAPRWAQEEMGAHRQVSAAGQRLVRAEHLLGDAVALHDAGRARRDVDPHRVAERPDALVVAEARRRSHQRELDERHVRLLDEDARRLPTRVLLDRHALPRWHGLTGDPRAPQRLAVGDRDERERMAPVAPDRADVDRVPRRDAVQLPARREAPLLEVRRDIEVEGRVAERHRHDPLARRRGSHQSLHALEHVVDRGGAGQ